MGGAGKKLKIKQEYGGRITMVTSSTMNGKNTK
jgi:hypothetical protein